MTRRAPLIPPGAVSGSAGGTIWIGIDDTDSPEGGCTTWVLSELLRESRIAGIDLVGEPRLVRLNPNIPWKTRGNAALAARFGSGRGARRRIGEIDGRPIWAFAESRAPDPDLVRRWIDHAWSCVRQVARSESPGTDPALVAVDHRLPADLYWNAVRDVVRPQDVRTALEREGALVRTSGSERGIVGASAAIAWPGTRRTWELIAYREPQRIGRPRVVDPTSVRSAQASHPGLFLCHDPRTRRMLVAPHTPCPILFGLRARRPEAALRARHSVRSEPVDRWVLFRTNQGTGDHLGRWTVEEIRPYRSAIVPGTVVAAPELLEGGHVRFPIEAAGGAVLRCVAFEPTKTLPRVARTLAVGDRVLVWGSRGLAPGLRLEGLALVRLSPARFSPRPPRCPSCRRTTDSLGFRRGYRCPGCRRRWPPEAATLRPRPTSYPVGVYHPTPSARRHLAVLGPE